MDSSSDTIKDLSQFISSEILGQPGRSLPTNVKLISSGLIDSLRLIDLAIFIENKFGVRIDDTELNVQTFDTLTELSALVDERRGH